MLHKGHNYKGSRRYHFSSREGCADSKMVLYGSIRALISCFGGSFFSKV